MIADAQPQIDAMLAMLLFVEARQILACDAAKHAAQYFEQHDILARLAQYCRRFEPDIAPADL